MDFIPSLQNVVYVSEANGSTTAVLNLNNTPNTTLTVRKQTYSDLTSGMNNTSFNLLVHKDAEVDKNGKIVWTNGSTVLSTKKTLDTRQY